MEFLLGFEYSELPLNMAQMSNGAEFSNMEHSGMIFDPFRTEQPSIPSKHAV